MTGRYLAPDPIGLAEGINPFFYSGNNPINLIDPLGLISQTSIDAINAVKNNPNISDKEKRNIIKNIPKDLPNPDHYNPYMNNDISFSEEDNKFFRCLIDKGIMVVPGLNLSPVDFNFLGYYFEDTDQKFSGGFYDALSGLAGSEQTKFKIIFKITGKEVAKNIGKKFGYLGLIADLKDAQEDLNECRCRSYK